MGVQKIQARSEFVGDEPEYYWTTDNYEGQWATEAQANAALKYKNNANQIPGLQQAADAAATKDELIATPIVDGETGIVSYYDYGMGSVTDPAKRQTYIDNALRDPLSWVANNLNWGGMGYGGDFSALDDQIKFLKDNKYDTSTLNKGAFNQYNLTKQILAQGTTGRWTGQGFGGPVENAKQMARVLSTAGIEDIKDFGKIKKENFQDVGVVPEYSGDEYGSTPTGRYYYADPETGAKQFFDAKDVTFQQTYDPEGGTSMIPVAKANVGGMEFYGNKKTNQAITQDYNQAYGNTFSGTYAGHGRTNYGVQFAADGMPYFYTQFGGDTSSMADIAPVLSILSIIPSPLQPFAAAANAIIAIDNGNTLGALASLAGIPGVSEAVGAAGLATVAEGIQTANKVVNLVNAIESGNVVALASAAGSAIGAGSTEIGDTGFTVSDAMKAVNLVNAIGSDDPTAIFRAAVSFAQSPNINKALNNQSTTITADGQKVADLVDNNFVAELVNPDSDSFLGNSEPAINTALSSASEVTPVSSPFEFQEAIARFNNLSGNTQQPVNLLRPDGNVADSGIMGPVEPAVVPGAENVANLITGGGETVAGAGGFTPDFVAAMPEMQPREGEVAGDVQEVEPGIYKRTISKTLADGTVVSYDITYDPENTSRPISYDTASGDQTSGFNIVSSGTRPNFDQQDVETGVSTDTSGQVQAEAGAPVATEPATPTEPAVAPVVPEQPSGPLEEPSITPPDALVPDASNPDLEAGKTPQERAAEEWKRYLDSLATKPSDLNLPGSTIEAGPYFDEYNANLKRIMDEGGYTSQWQNANGDKVFVNDDGTAIGINQDGGTYSLSDAQVEDMVSKGLLNTAESGYVDATGGTGSTPGGTPEDTTKEAEPEKQCGEGFHFDEARGICVADTDTKENEECPPGYVRNLNTGACELATTGDPNVRLNNLNGSDSVKNKVSVQAIPSSYFIPEQPIVSAPSINDDPIMQGALPSIPQETKFEGPLDQFLKLVTGSSFVPQQPQQNQQQAENMDTKLSYPQGGSDYFSYGQQSDIENNLYPSFGQNSDEQSEQNPQQFNRGGLAVPLMAAGGTRYGKYATGGLNIVHHSGKNRVDFRRGDAVTGPGDGQSDDIPAMLADGEFVFPADVVAALGNGSTKAGSDKLYEMMHAIRAHHRSAKPQDLPPPAKKSPLDYLKTRKARR